MPATGTEGTNGEIFDKYELKTKLIRYGLSLGYDYETVVEAASGLVTDTETCDEF